MTENKLNEDSLMGPEVLPLILLSQTGGSQDADSPIYDTGKLVHEILDNENTSPKLFVINLPDAEVARYFCSEIVNRIFRRRKSNFTLIPRIVFVSL